MFRQFTLIFIESHHYRNVKSLPNKITHTAALIITNRNATEATRGSNLFVSNQQITFASQESSPLSLAMVRMVTMVTTLLLPLHN